MLLGVALSKRLLLIKKPWRDCSHFSKFDVQFFIACVSIHPISLDNFLDLLLMLFIF